MCQRSVTHYLRILVVSFTHFFFFCYKSGCEIIESALLKYLFFFSGDLLQPNPQSSPKPPVYNLSEEHVRDISAKGTYIFMTAIIALIIQ